MKKKLRSQIRSLAEEILAQEGANSTKEMKETARKLYEQLSVLHYLEDQILGEELKTDSESLDSKSFREQNWFKEPEPLPQPENQDEIVEPLMEKIKDIVAQMPEESHKVDALLEEVLPKKEYMKNDLEEFASNYRDMPVFEKKIGSVVGRNIRENEPGQEIENNETNTHNDVERPKSLNDSLGNGLNIGLNDRLAFIKHLFDGKTEDYKRVLSQISSFNNYEDAQNFIKGKVKPDYNYWLQKEEYSKRFMKIIEKSFN
ncbi:MAG: hypothetical protein HKN48_07480 [Flavobacteriaceae bacterium]|nr:hypothetical protein [Flavobacteriaceae bacterium]